MNDFFVLNYFSEDCRRSLEMRIMERSRGGGGFTSGHSAMLTYY